MAFKYTFILAVVISAVLATPSGRPDDDSAACNGTKFESINRELSKFRTCLKDLLNTELKNNITHSPTCKTIEDAEKLKAPVVAAAVACKKSVNDTNVALDLFISMMNISVANKDILTPERIKCINDSKEELRQCVKNKIPGQDKLAEHLGHKDVLALEILHLNFQPSELKKALDLQKCISNVWNTKKQCSDISKISDQLFEKGIAKIPRSDREGSTGGGGSNEIAGSILMIASMLLVL